MNPHNPPPAPRTADAYDRLEVWLDSPEFAFASWLKGLRLGNRSRVVYLAMWSKFVRWLERQPTRLELCSSHHLSSFLDEHELYRESRYRYARLIERAYAHLDSLGLKIPNPGSIARSQGIASGENDRTRFFTREQRGLIERTLHEFFTVTAAEPPQGSPEKGEPDEEKWTELRDAVIAALMLGAGAKVSEVLALPVNCTWGEGFLLIPGVGKKGERRARLLPIGHEALALWHTQLPRIGFASDRLLPAQLSRRRHDQLTGSAALHPSTLFRGVARVLERASIRGERATGQTLRNTYAATLIEAGASDEDLAENLGLRSSLSAARIRQQYQMATMDGSTNQETTTSTAVGG